MKLRNSFSIVPVFLFVLVVKITTVDSQDSPNQNKTQQPIKSTIFEATDFEMNPQLEIREHSNTYSLIIKKFLAFARARRYFYGETARYNVSINYLDHFLGEPLINFYVEKAKVGSIKLNKPEHGERDLYTESSINLPGINIRKWSEIAFDITNDVPVERTDRLHIKRIVFTPAGPYQGEKLELENPEPLRIFDTIEVQGQAREMMPRFVEKSLQFLHEKRTEELERLRTPEDWKKQQNNIRARLDEYFGKFPEKTPLNPRIIDVIEREKYNIEKLIFESQPNYYCSVNFYVPTNRSFKVPGVLVAVGHKEHGKSRLMYHELCLGLVLKGYAVLIVDPMGQGERSEYFDVDTKKHFLERKIDQHHYFGRQAFLADWSIASLRTWDCIRAVDYLVSRAEVDTNKLAVVGNSGGGQMAMYITAVDRRIKVCAAGHPGGSCESMLLNGMGLSVHDIYSLIPPRPFRIIIGRESREAPGHVGTIKALKPIYQGYGASEDALDMSIVGGLHDIKLPKRVSVYEWFNKWLDKEYEGSAEPPLQPEKMKLLWCAESGFTLISFGGETGQTLVAKRANQIYRSEKDFGILKERVVKRIGLNSCEKNKNIVSKPMGVYTNKNIHVEKVIIQSEKGIDIPALLMKPNRGGSNNLLYLHVSDQGKPTEIDKPSIPLELVSKGFDVISIDVRGIGETDPSPPIPLTKFTARPELQWRRDVLAINSLSFKKTMLGMRTFDVLKVIDYIKSCESLKDKSIIVVGEGLGGLWALMAAIYHSDVNAVVCIGTLPSYKLLLNSQYYNVWNYFWVPGALRDFDIPDLSRLAAPRRQLWINPVNALGEPLEEKMISEILTNREEYQFVRAVDTTPGSLATEIIQFLH